MTAPIRVEVNRGGAVESVHRVHVVQVGPDGQIAAAWGDAGTMAFWRSAMKPFQSIVLLRSGALDAAGFDDRHLALTAASHHARPEHVEGITEMLERLGLTDESLACGPQAPVDGEAARAVAQSGHGPGRVHNNCSGKHAGMLALARRLGAPLEGYEQFDHPAQAAAREELRVWLDSDPDALIWATDGCAVPTPRLPLSEMARAYMRLTAAEPGDGDARRVVTAMIAHPTLISGPAALSCRLMQVGQGRWLAKEGAEGVFCVAGREAGWGMALKVADGATRAVGPALLAAMDELGELAGDDRDQLEEHLRAPVTNSRDERVGSIEARAEAAGVS